ncbi:hypothetical protein [Lysinibacillus sp. 54212]|uniref:hypothetical protein n=1 Tax=Lysinibacillus sp. 54212 TaxID=3119829 RepID=UPI002FC7CFB4
MILIKGITGFFYPGIDDLPAIDNTLFKQLCYNLANFHKGQVIVFEEPDFSRNFYHSQIQFHDQSIHLFLHVVYPFVAVSRYYEYPFMKDFIDIPQVNKFFEPSFRVLPAKDLNELVRIENGRVMNKNDLHPNDLREILYWQPEIIGHIIYNYFD